MLGTNATRALLGPADPARGLSEPEPRLSAMAMIDRADATTVLADVGRPAAHRRGARRAVRFALPAMGTAVAAAAAVAVVIGGGIDTTRGPRTDANVPIATIPAAPAPGDLGLVVTPVAYAITVNPPSAGDELRALAKRIGDAPYDSRTGRYAYVHSKIWNDPQMRDPSGRFTLGYAHEYETWRAADTLGLQHAAMLPYEFPDEASRDFYKGMPRPNKEPRSMRLEPAGTLPTDRAGLAKQLNAAYGPGAMAKAVATAYSRHALSRPSRAMVLEILADEPGFQWRGQVTDRAGRKGVAITGDERGTRSVLIFDPATGALLASEMVSLKQSAPALSSYMVFLTYDRRDDVPPAPTAPVRAPATPGGKPGAQPGS